ncbi:hypothetical protein ACIP9H_30060 [Streptomyces sp. NPDC088732]
MNAMNTVFNAVALSFSLLALLVSAVSARRQAEDVRRTNLLLFVVELSAAARAPEFRESLEYVRDRMGGHDPAAGVTGLPRPARDHAHRAGGFYQELGVLVVTGVIDEDKAVAMHYTGIKETWRALEPFVRAERQRLAAREGGGFWGSFEHLAVYTARTPYSDLGARFPRRRFPEPRPAPEA